MRKCDFLCHDDVIIRLGDDDVIVDICNVTRCHNDVILNDGQLRLNLRVRTSSSLLFVFRFSSINALFYSLGSFHTNSRNKSNLPFSTRIQDLPPPPRQSLAPKMSVKPILDGIVWNVEIPLFLYIY